MANELDGILFGENQVPYDFVGKPLSELDDSEAELNIGDDNGNVVAEFKSGDFRTKNFDSRKSNKTLEDESEADLNIGDNNGNVVAEFKGGHIRTKNFDSRNAGNSIRVRYSDDSIIVNNHTAYKLVSGVLTSFVSDNVGYAILPIRNGMHVQATSTPSGGIGDMVIPAIVYLSDKDDLTSIIGTPLFGTTNNAISSSWKDFNADLTPPLGANYVFIQSNLALSPNNAEISWINSTEGAIKDINDEICNLSSNVDEINALVGTGNKIKVKTSPGEGEYNNITDAMAAAKAGDTIYMYDGTYEVVGLQYKRGVKIVGIGNVIIKGENPDDTDPSIIVQYATIDAFYGCDIENVTITAKNCRYCIHSQTGSGAKPSVFKLLNVTLIHYGNQGAYEYQRDHAGGTIQSVFRAISCWGCGLNGGDRIYMDGCKLIGRMRSWSVHNGYNQNTAANTAGACIGIMNNCEFISYGIDNDGSLLDYNDAIHIQSLPSNTNDQMIFNNCKASGFLIAQLTETNIPTIKVFCGGMKNLKLRFSTYGGINNGMVDQKDLFVNNTDWYPVMKDEISYFVNRGSVTIPKGYAVKKSTLGGIALMTSSDSASDFFGVALQDMEAGKTGDVKVSGFIQQIYCEGIRSTTLTDGQDVYVTSTGSFTTSGSVKVMVYEDNQNLRIK